MSRVGGNLWNAYLILTHCELYIVDLAMITQTFEYISVIYLILKQRKKKLEEIYFDHNHTNKTSWPLSWVLPKDHSNYLKEEGFVFLGFWITLLLQLSLQVFLSFVKYKDEIMYGNEVSKWTNWRGRIIVYEVSIEFLANIIFFSILLYLLRKYH